MVACNLAEENTVKGVWPLPKGQAWIVTSSLLVYSMPYISQFPVQLTPHTLLTFLLCTQPMY